MRQQDGLTIMPAYSGKYLYTGERGESLQQGPCQLTFDAETCIITPAGGTLLAFDLGDVDRTTPAEWDLQLTLSTGRTVTLKQFGAAFSDMSRELLAAWRDRTVRCLLLEDLEELGSYQGLANRNAGRNPHLQEQSRHPPANRRAYPMAARRSRAAPFRQRHLQHRAHPRRRAPDPLEARQEDG
jgi:hypothetical protein